MIPLASGGYTLPFVGPGTYVIFGIVLLPVYIMLAAWFLGEPRDRKSQLLGVSYVTGITVGLWTGALIATMVIKFIFF